MTERPRPRRFNAVAAQRAGEAWRLRVAGASWADIARTVGYANESNAIRAIRNYAGRLPEPSTHESRTLWRARLERLWGFADRDAELARPGAIRAGVAIAQRAAQLDGLDAPQRHEIELDLSDPQHVAAIYRVLGIQPPPPPAPLAEGHVIEWAEIEQ